MEQALTTSLREEQRFKSDVARREAQLEKQQKDKEEKRAATLKSIAAHREEKIKEREQREKAELQSSQDWLQAQKQSDRLHVKREQLKTQRIREVNLQINSFNASLAAEQRARLQWQKEEERDAAVRNAEQIAEKEKKHQQYIQQELLKTAVKTGGHGLANRDVPVYITANNGEALPKLGSAETKCIKLCQERNRLQLNYREIEAGLGSSPPLSHF